jgi:hypothetical protein
MKSSILIALTIFLLSACGGSGSSSSTTTSTTLGTPGDTASGSAGSGNGQRITAANYDFDNNGTAEGRAVFSYDANGFITMIEYTYSDDGTTDTDFRTFSLNFGQENKTWEFGYDIDGYLETWIITTPSSKTVLTNSWNADNLISNVTSEFFNGTGALQTTVRFDLNYTATQLDSWDEEFEQPGSSPMFLAQGQITYNMMTNLPSQLSRTDLGGTTEVSALTFLGGGQISQIITTIPSLPTYQADVGFSYAAATNVQNTTEGNIFNRQDDPNDPADTYNWAYSYNGALLDELYVDMGSDTTLDAAVSHEWENGECERHFFWQPRTEPNFIAPGHAPYIPGTGYAILDFCDTFGTTGPL